MSDEIFREVDEDVRRDRALEWWKRYAVYVVVLALCIVAAVAAWKFYEASRQRQAEADSGRYVAAGLLDRDGKAEDAGAAFQALSGEAAAGYRVLARLRAANDTGLRERSAGVAAFDAIAADTTLDASIRDVAAFRAALMVVDTADLGEIHRRLDPLADANNPLRNPAREMLAVAALRAGDVETAGTALDRIVTDPSATQDLRQRADLMLGVVRSAKPAPK